MIIKIIFILIFTMGVFNNLFCDQKKTIKSEDIDLVGTWKVNTDNMPKYIDEYARYLFKGHQYGKWVTGSFKENETKYRKYAELFLKRKQVAFQKNNVFNDPKGYEIYRIKSGDVEVRTKYQTEWIKKFRITEKGRKLIKIADKIKINNEMFVEPWELEFVKVDSKPVSLQELRRIANVKMKEREKLDTEFREKIRNSSILELKEYLRSSDALTRMIATETLAYKKDKSSFPAIAKLLSHPHPGTRACAREYMGKLKIKKSIKYVIPILKNLKDSLQDKYDEQEIRKTLASIVGIGEGFSKEECLDWWKKNKDKPEYHFTKDTQKK